QVAKHRRIAAEIDHPPEPRARQQGVVDQLQMHVVVGETARDYAALDAADVGHSWPPAGRPISVRTLYSSGKKVRLSARCRKSTPVEPPVPFFMPIVRDTVRRWRNRQNWKLSSTS